MICDRISSQQYELRLESCGSLYFDEDSGRCVQQQPSFAVCGRPVYSDEAEPTFPNEKLQCRLHVNPDNPRQYKPKDLPNTSTSYTIYQSCEKHSHFSESQCQCIADDTAPKHVCDRKCFLYVNFENNLKDSSCTRAWIGGAVSYRKSIFGTSGVFDGKHHVELPIMDGIFDGNYLSGFSVSLFFKSNYQLGSSLLFDNSDSQGHISIFMGIIPRYGVLKAEVKMTGWQSRGQTIALLHPFENRVVKWHHVAYVFNNGQLSITLDGNTESKSVFKLPSSSGSKFTIDNVKESMRIGGRRSNKYMFKGAMDELRIFKRAISDDEIKRIVHRDF